MARPITRVRVCPFCGDTPSIFRGDYGFGQGWYVTCQNDGCPACATVVADTENDAIRAWNRRARSSFVTIPPRKEDER